MTVCKVNAMSQAHLIKMLLDGDRNCRELAEESGLHYVTVLEYCRELYKVGALYICRWDKDARDRDMIKIYKLGPGKDVKKTKLTGAQRQQRVRASRNEQQKVLVLGGMGQYVASSNGRVRFEKHEAEL